MPEHPTLEALIEWTYMPSMDASVWPATLKHLATEVGNCSLQLCLLKPSGDGKIHWRAFSGPEPEPHHPPRHIGNLARRLEQKPESFFVQDNEKLLPLEHFNTDEALGQLLHPDGMDIFFNVGDFIAHFNLRCTQRNTNHYEPMTALKTLLPHIRRSLQITEQITQLQHRSSSLEATMDRLNWAIIMVDEALATTYMNRRAEEMLKHSKTLQINSSGQLSTFSAPHSQRLRKLLAEAISFSEQGTMQLGAMSVPCIADQECPETRCNKCAPISIIATPINNAFLPIMPKNTVRATLLIGCPGFGSNINPELLQLLFGLTQAEARLAAGIGEGMSLEDYCRENGIRISTARSYLKLIFQKTGANRQSELASLLHNIPI